MSEETSYLWRSEPEPPEEVIDHREEGIGLCLSGGGYRAMIFHLGALWRLNELGYLGRVRRVSSVSGGSITAAVLGVNWHRLDFGSDGVSRHFVEVCVNPVRKMAGITIDLPSIIGGILGPGSVNKRVINAYCKHLFGTKTLQDLPDDTDGPRFVINATNVQSGVLCRFSKPYIWDYRVGCIDKPEVEIARVVAASSACPPLLSPAELHFEANEFVPNSGKDLQRPPFTTRMFLTDGDTPYVSIPIRMLSIDTPEVHYPGNQKPSKHDALLAELANGIYEGRAPINRGLAQYLHPKLATGSAGTLQERQGVSATNKFEELINEKLTRPSGSKRSIFLHAADTPFDNYGRLLAYMAPCYSSKELASISQKDRATFNLVMVESGWAASFLIYPSLPRYADLVIFHQAAKDAYDNQRGAWADQMMLTGYEFRMCIRLHQISKKLEAGENLSSRGRGGWVTRYCVDMTTREIREPEDYYKVIPYNRIFIWPQDVAEAVGKMNLVPA